MSESPQVKIAFQKLNEGMLKAALELLRDRMITHWRIPRLSRDTEWETAQAAVTQEAKIEAITQFFNELERSGS